MAIIIKNILEKTYHFIRMVQHYYRLLQYVYSIITTKISSIKSDLILQIFFQAINKSVGLNKLVFTLLVFNIYLKIIKQDVLSLSITLHAMAMQ